MKGKGPKHERETIIRFDEESDEATIWTASEPLYRKLLKRGCQPAEDAERHAEFKLSKREIKLPRPKRQLSEAQRAAATERMKKARAARNGGIGPDEAA